MATLQEIERALINADRAGDTDAAHSLAQEYRRVEAQNRTAIDQSNEKEVRKGDDALSPAVQEDFYKKNPGYAPTSGGDLRNFVAGYGKSAVDYGRGAAQIGLDELSADRPTALNALPVIGPMADIGRRIAMQFPQVKQPIEDAQKSLQENINESRKLDAPLMDTKAGFGGNLFGNVLNAAPAMFAPGANTYLGTAALGGMMSALQPTLENESRVLNTGIGGLTGILARGLLDGLRLSYRGAKGMIQPFTESGQKTIAADTIRNFAGNADDAARNVANVQEIVPGSQPTLAEAANDAGISQLQRTLQSQNPRLADELSRRGMAQNAARTTELNSLTKYSGNLDDAIERRGDIGEKLYEKAFGKNLRVNDALKEIADRPSFQSALSRAQRIATERGDPMANLFDQEGRFASTKALHLVKMGYDDMINQAKMPGSNIGAAELSSIKSTRGKLLDWISKNNPAYNTARARFEKASRPINRQEVVNELYSRATGRQLPNAMGDINISPSAFSNALKNEGGNIVKAATGRKDKVLSDVLTPTQMSRVANVNADLARAANAQTAGKSIGSNTAQNLSGQNLLRQLLGSAAPQSLADNTVLRTAIRPFNALAKLGEGNIQDVLARAVMDPAYAAQLLSAPVAKPSQLLPIINRFPGLLSGGTAASLQ